MALTKVGTDGIKDDAVTIAKQAAGTDGQIITYDASGNPKAIGPGTDGQVLTSAGAGAEPAFEDAVSEGTQVKSTGESGGTKFLREDGDGTCSWQTVSAGTALTGSTDNTITTVTGANAIQGEANLTFDGNNLDVSGGCITTFGANTTNEAACIKVGYEGSSKGQVRVYGADASTTGSLEFKVCEGDGTDDHTVLIDGSGNLKVDDGNLVIGTAGKGIDFSATSDATGKTSELLHDYEEGTFTLTLTDTSGNNATSGGTGHYTKIGRWVNCWGQIVFGDAATSVGGNHCAIKGWPFSTGSHNSNDIPVWIWNNGTDLYEDGYASVSTSTSNTVWGLYIHRHGGAPTITGNDMGNGAYLSLGFSYEV